MTMLQGVQRHRFVEIDRKMYKDPMVRFTVCRSEDTMVRITELVASGIHQLDDLGNLLPWKPIRRSVYTDRQQELPWVMLLM